MISLHKYYIYFKRPLFKLSYQEEFNSGNFVLIRLLEGKKMEKVLKN